MKKHILIATTLALLGMECAYSNCNQMSTEDELCASIPDPEQNIANCKSYMFPYPICYKNAQGTRKKFYTCGECEDGYVLTLNPNFTAMGCDSGSAYVCQPCSVVKACSPNSKPDYDPDAWRDSWKGYQINSYAECNTDTCEWESRAQYRCSAGYYGISDDITENYVEGFGVMGLNGCTLCPLTAAAQLGKSDAGDNETVLKCYTDQDGTDVTGSFVLLPSGSRCYYN